MPLVVIAIILGLIQGLGEFLPISSSGHLILAQHIFGLDDPEVAFDVVLHIGTLLAVIFFYRRPLASLCRELTYLPKALISPTQMKSLFKTRPDFRFGILVLVGSLPTGVIGLLFQNAFKTYLTSPLTIGVALCITGFLLKLAGRRGRTGREETEMTIRDALIIGLVQGLAITPGFSRSGFTICAGLFLGLKRELAARYSFILSIPAIVGALILELRHGFDSQFHTFEFLAGFAVAAVTGYLALSLLVRLLKSDNFGIFAYWCWGVGFLAIIFGIFKI